MTHHPNETPEPLAQEQAREMPVVAYLVTNLSSGEPSLCFEDERGDYGDEDHMPVFEELCRRSDFTAALQAKDAEIAGLKADAGRLDWLSGRDLNDLAVGYLEGKVLLNIGCGDIFEGDDLRGAIDHARKYGQPS